jgi:lactoylglutathione lyase
MDSSSKLNIKLAVPFLTVADMEASLRFYREGLGFTMTKQWTPRGKIEWCWLQRDAVALMLQEQRRDKEYSAEPGGQPKLGPEMEPKLGPEKEPKLGPEMEPKTGPSICFQCEDALALYHEFKERGIVMKEPFVGNGMWVVVLNDPDGYTLDFESVADVAEETTYSEWRKLAGTK